MEDFQDVLSFMRGKVLLEMSFSPFKDDLARKKLCNEHIRVIYFLIIYVMYLPIFRFVFRDHTHRRLLFSFPSCLPSLC